MIRVAKDIKPPEDFSEVLDVLIGEMALTRRKIESLVEILDEKGVFSQAEFKDKLKKKSEEEKINLLVKSHSIDAG
jgi:hypothetical protein